MDCAAEWQPQLTYCSREPSLPHPLALDRTPRERFLLRAGIDTRPKLCHPQHLHCSESIHRRRNSLVLAVYRCSQWRGPDCCGLGQRLPVSSCSLIAAMRVCRGRESRCPRKVAVDALRAERARTGACGARTGSCRGSGSSWRLIRGVSAACWSARGRPACRWAGLSETCCWRQVQSKAANCL